MTIVDPEPTARSSSRTEASKLGEAKWRVRDCGVRLYRCTCSAQKSARPAWVTTTPFGRPVEPEV